MKSKQLEGVVEYYDDDGDVCYTIGKNMFLGCWRVSVGDGDGMSCGLVTCKTLNDARKFVKERGLPNLNTEMYRLFGEPSGGGKWFTNDLSRQQRVIGSNILDDVEFNKAWSKRMKTRYEKNSW